MKKTSFYLWYVFLLTSLVACDKNDDVQNNPQSPTDGFTIQGQFYETPNCYIEFDNTNQDKIWLFFLDGRMLENVNNLPDANGNPLDYLFSVNTTNWVFLKIKNSVNPSISTPQYPNIQTGIQYVGDVQDFIVHNGTIESYSPPIMNNGTEYGYDEQEYPPNDPDFQTHKVGTVSPLITLNSYQFDNNTQTGTINVDYTFVDATGNNIAGHYEGTFGVFVR